MLLLGTWRGPQPTIQLVRPRVIRALQARTVSGAVHDFMTPVATDVDQGANALGSSDYNNRDVSHHAREVVADPGKLLGPSHVLPGTTEDALHLMPADSGVRIPRGRQPQTVVQLVVQRA